MSSIPLAVVTDEVVAPALRAWRAGRTLHTPGTGHAAMSGILARLPRALARRITERAFRR